MHKAAYKYVQQYATRRNIPIIEIGSRNINGTVRPLFPNSQYTGLDLYPGPAVDVVRDAELWFPPEPVECVICCEVLEHAPNWKELIASAYRYLKDGHRFIMTCAGPGRTPHNRTDGSNKIEEDEYYQNLSAIQVAEVLISTGFSRIENLEQVGLDTRCCVRK